MDKNEDFRKKFASAVEELKEKEKRERDAREKHSRKEKLGSRLFGTFYLLGLFLIVFHLFVYDKLPSQVRKQEYIEYYDSLRNAKVDSTRHFKVDSVRILYNPKDTISIWSNFDAYDAFDANKLITKLTKLTYGDTVYLSTSDVLLMYSVGRTSLYHPQEIYECLIMTNTFSSKLHDSYVRFDSIQIMDWPQKPFNIIYLTLLSDESFGREARRMWNHLHYDSIQ